MRYISTFYLSDSQLPRQANVQQGVYRSLYYNTHDNAETALSVPIM